MESELRHDNHITWIPNSGTISIVLLQCAAMTKVNDTSYVDDTTVRITSDVKSNSHQK